jgi:anti-sigma factor RsiW
MSAADHPQDDCRRYLGSLSEYFDGDLSAELCQALEAHMAQCDHCRVVVNTFNKTIVLYHQLPTPDVPDAVKERLYKVLHLDEYLPVSQEKHSVE